MRAAGVSTVKADYAIEVLKADQCSPYHIHIGRSEDAPFSTSGRGFPQLIPLDKLRPAGSPYLANDSLLLRVELTVNDTVAAE